MRVTINKEQAESLLTCLWREVPVVLRSSAYQRLAALILDAEASGGPLSDRFAGEASTQV